MRRTALTAVAAFLAGGIATGAVLSYAQPAPPPAAGPMADHAAGPMGVPPHPWMHWMHHRMEGGPAHGMRAFALVFREKDRDLTAADVQKIAEAFLLWNGNHTWKVIDTAPTTDGQIGFSLATANGSIVAKFTMDPHTAHLTRVG
ncbi:MAG TPA: hypothetical protein VHB27_14955 [Rhodopila sp.]|uniref:hypothetical protein n=1 Tax=Rhodopila sp. TaxID=2480087 RepID=UPI002BEE157A|nr:hypothetical protein [Rhodopila sp.]HVY16524.1 hypothetical protein [Rhodopila sp.]